MINILVVAQMGCRLLWEQLFAFSGACFAGSVSIYQLPMTGGDGPLIVTAIGIGLAVMSLLLLFVMKRTGKKDKGKPGGQKNNPHRVPPPNASAGNGSFRQ